MTRLLTCKDLMAELNSFLDDTADPNLRQELQRHVSECPNCWVIVDTTQKTLKVFKGMQAQEIPPGIESRVMKALERKIAADKSNGNPSGVNP